MVKYKDMQFFIINMKMKRKKEQKNWPFPAGIWTPDFWTNSRPKFKFLWRLDPSSSGFLELLDFIDVYKFGEEIFKIDIFWIFLYKSNQICDFFSCPLAQTSSNLRFCVFFKKEPTSGLYQKDLWLLLKLLMINYGRAVSSSYHHLGWKTLFILLDFQE